jgi:ubiquinone/menaquinone biosynthesis C-methylase UbiE
LTGSPEQPAETAYRRAPGYAQHYQQERFSTGSGKGTLARERRALQALLNRAAAGPGSWLDMPCGTGRLSGMLPQPTVLVDRDMAMLQLCSPDSARLRARALALPFADDSFAGALCMRLLHHIPEQEERSAILRELGRVTNGPIIVSFFHSFSLQHGRRVLARLFGKPRSGRSAISLSQFARDLQRANLQQVASHALNPFISEQRLVLLKRLS